MIIFEEMEAARQDDAELVAKSLEGNHSAFGQIVERYQTLICSLAYSATGSVSQSEDLAQETFVTAWKQLSQLREPSKLRSWLCALVRFRISKQFRRQDREPAHAADPLEAVDQSAAPEALPSDQAISNEEKAILWRALERIPETYREALVLFYREHQSIEHVAEELDLTEDAVKQRLSRGRKMLQDEFLAFIQGALERTTPGAIFTQGVLTALPHLATAASSSAVGTAALKGGAAGKAVSSAGIVATLSGLLLKLLPAVAGTWMMLRLPESERERKFARKAYAGLWLLAILYPLALLLVIYAGRSYWDAHPQMLTVGIIGTTFAFVTVVGPYTFWMSRVQKRIRTQGVGTPVNTGYGGLSRPFEYRSRRTFLGLPLLHIRVNCVEGGKTLPAKGWIAVGNRAYGILFAAGTFAVGGMSCGPLAVGAVALGGFGLGLFAFGGLAVGAAAIGGAALGYVAYGGGAIGWLGASGGAVLARHFAMGGGALATHANDPAAHVFMQSSAFFRHAEVVAYALITFSFLVPPAISLGFKRWRAAAEDRQNH
ncbi:MAG: sigma-70 family RNA polymerase sigma factor [Verrucomicrobia bacterium]|nr:MAG: sigma-70 family RNA polymerase sigma factor [Verrucomicrobiota bacterium]